MQHPPWSPGAGPQGGISWCCGHRNTFVWWSLAGSSRMTPGLVHHWRTVGIERRGALYSIGHNTTVLSEKENLTVQSWAKLITLSWVSSSSLQRPHQCKLEVLGCLGREVLVMTSTKRAEPYGKSVCITPQKSLLVPRLLLSDSTWLRSIFHKSLEVGWSNVSIHWYDYKMIREII